MKVVEQKAYGWSAEELHFQHPYLTLGQIHSALAYLDMLVGDPLLRIC